MEPYADASCVLSMDTNCEECKFGIVEVINSITGVYSITIEAEQNLVKIFGEVDPYYLLSALAREGKHVKIVKANLKHPRLRQPYPMYTHGNGYGQGYCQGHYGNYTLGHGHGYARAPLHAPQLFPLRSAYYPSDYCSSRSCVRTRPFAF